MSEEKGFVIVDDVQYDLVKRGRQQAEQVMGFTRWLTKYGVKAIRAVQAEGKVERIEGIEFIGKALEQLNADALIDLFTVVVGCPKEVSELHFDVGILVEAAMVVYNGQPSIQRLLDRFFSTPTSETTSEESSTNSEQPTA